MNNYSLTLDTIARNCESEKRENIKHVLILHEAHSFFIGDTCIRLGSLRYLKEYFPGAVISICFVNTKRLEVYSALLYNNPGIDNVFGAKWEEIDFYAYEVVFFGAYDEVDFVAFLQNKYMQPTCSRQFETAVYSFSQFVFPPKEGVQFFFSQNERLLSYVTTRYSVSKPNEIYLKNEERQAADKWLEAMGVRQHERLIIFLDSTSRKNKLIRIDVYFDVLMSVLKQDDVKVLVYDEKNIGKEAFYGEWIGEKNMQKMIFAKSRPFRDEIAILGSSYTRMIFGPCTGLIHCASCIYNHFVNNGMDIGDVPDMITYTGQYPEAESNANVWWGKAPLVSCLLLIEKNGKKQISLLSSLSEAEKQNYTQIPTSEYTAEMLINFIGTRLNAHHKAGWHTRQHNVETAKALEEIHH